MNADNDTQKAPQQSSDLSTMDNAPTTTASLFEIGQIVHVAARTGPGINQPGGVARVISVSHHLVSVKYVIDGRHEKNIAPTLVTAYEQTTRLRDRSVLLGRCLHCGSLRADCDSCDIRASENNHRRQRSLVPKPLPLDSLQSLGGPTEIIRQANHRGQPKPAAAAASFEENGDSDDTEKLWKRLRRRDKLFQRYKAQQLQQDLPQNSRKEIIIDKEHDFVSNTQVYEPRSSENKPGRWQGRRRNSDISVKPTAASAAPHSAASSQQTRQSQDNLEDGSSVSSQGSVESDDETSVSHSDSLNYGFGEADSLDNSIAAHDDDEELPNEHDLDFIAPEGDAEGLPSDIVDKTKGKSKSELLTFFDATMQAIETKALPRAKAKLQVLGLRIKDIDHRWQEEKEAVDRSLLLDEAKEVCNDW
jgi:DNA segregation ATPase FtsK/SpoIIIE-like protein